MNEVSKNADPTFRWRVGAFYSGIVVIFVLPPLLWIWLFVFSNTRMRIEHEHGLKLPASANHFVCSGDAWMSLDRGASSIFQIQARDLPNFLAQLNTNLSYETFIPGNSEYDDLPKPWTAEAKPAQSYACVSPVGDWLHVEVYPLASDRVAVWLHTDWN